MDGDFRQHFVNLYCKDTTLVFQAMRYFRQQLSRPVVPDSVNLSIEPTIKGCMVPRFVELLTRYDQPNIQVEAAWALTNLACGTTVETWMLVAVGAAQKLVEVVGRSSNAEVRDQAVWAISNIAGDSHDCREYLLQIGALEACLSEFNRYRYRKYSLTSKALESRRNLMWALSNLCRSRSSSTSPWIKFVPVVQIIGQLFSNAANLDDDDLVSESCWTLAYLMDGNNNWSPVQTVLQADIVPSIVNLLSLNHRNPNRVLPAVVRAIGNIVTGTAEQTQAVLDAGVLPRLRNLLNMENDALVREIAWLLSNITAGTEQQIASVLEHEDLFANLILMSGGHRSSQVRREATWAICNALSGGQAEQKLKVISYGCTGPLCRTLATCEDQRLLEALLTSVEIIATVGREKQTATFDNNSFVPMLCEFDIVDILKKTSENSRWAFSNRLRCVQLLGDYFNNGVVEEKKDDGFIVIEFIRKRKSA